MNLLRWEAPLYQSPKSAQVADLVGAGRYYARRTKKGSREFTASFQPISDKPYFVGDSIFASLSDAMAACEADAKRYDV